MPPRNQIYTQDVYTSQTYIQLFKWTLAFGPLSIHSNGVNLTHLIINQSHFWMQKLYWFDGSLWVFNFIVKYRLILQQPTYRETDVRDMLGVNGAGNWRSKLQLKEILTTLREMALFVKILFSVFKTKISTNNPKHKTLIKTQKLLSH